MNYIIISFVLLLALMQGCLPISANRSFIDLSNNHSEYPILEKSYPVGEIYTTKTDLYICGNADSGFGLAQPGGVLPFFGDYKSNPKAYDSNKHPFIVGILESGSPLKINRLAYQKGVGSAASCTTAFAEILIGEYENTTVDLFSISELIYGTPVGILAVPDHRYIQISQEYREYRGQPSF